MLDIVCPSWSVSAHDFRARSGPAFARPPNTPF